MKRIADLIAQTLLERGIEQIFCLVGGGSMYLNDALGHCENLNVLYNHHEQACAMAAEGYVRTCGKMAAVCVTTGPGGTNAITGVLGAYQDNYPMLVISGQVRKPTGVQSTGLNLRFMGEQEHNIVDTVRPLTKYARYIDNEDDVIYELEKAVYIANEGRKGPVWIDVPMDIQNASVDEGNIRHFTPELKKDEWNSQVFLNELDKSERPVICVGSAIRSVGYVEEFRKLSGLLKMPVVAATYNADLMCGDDEFYFGNFGIIGGRAGNIIVQNADLVIGMGCRMTFRQIGFNYEQFSPKSRRMIIDVDENELRKPTLRIDVPICEDIKTVIAALLEQNTYTWQDKVGWLEYCKALRKRYPIYQDKFNAKVENQINPYYLGNSLKKYISEDEVIVLGNSTIAAHILQLGIDKQKQRIINNMNCGSMGYDLPAAIGAAVAIKRPVTLITGDGSFMLNLQELMTAKHYGLPIKIFVSCNGGYIGIVRSQSNMFSGRHVGCTYDTGIEIPNFERIAYAFGIKFIRISNKDEVEDKLRKIYDSEELMLIEWPQDPDQLIEPRTASKKDANGNIYSSDIDDLGPHLSVEEYESTKFDAWIKNKR